MGKQTITKIISGLIILVFVVSIFKFALPTQVSADNATKGSVTDLYSNPNQNNGKNPYKFALAQVLKSGMIQSVVGCSGVVNKVSSWMIKIIQSPVQQAKIAAEKLKIIRNQLEATCAATKAGAQTGAGVVPQVNDLVSTVKTILSKINIKVAGIDTKPCVDQVKEVSDDKLAELVKQTEQEASDIQKTQCFDGIAITLAKNQLTSMTRSAMNWVNSGYGGNPFFVQNIGNLKDNIGKNILESSVNRLLLPMNQSPYAQDFARTTVLASNGVAITNSLNFLDSLKSDLGYFVTDPKSYLPEDQIKDTRTSLQKSRDATNAFSSDFSMGGWNGWLAFTQRDQNNPLGYTMLAAQNIADSQTQKIDETNSELTQNGGFLSQQTCIRWQVYNPDGTPLLDTSGSDFIEGGNATDGQQGVPVYSSTKPIDDGGKSVCAEYKTITPGSIIKDKTTNYLNSPERQLELAKTINDSLNALFSILISKLEEGGLYGLSDSVVNTTNWTDNTNDLASLDGNTPYDNNGSYDNFNLTSDLGNTYLHVTPTSLGTWDAKNNKITPAKKNAQAALVDGQGNSINSTKLKNGYKLYPDLAPESYDANGNANSSINSYYTVNVAGNTKIILDGYNGWVVGDRAFWDGSGWQNWKKGQANPIKKRGVIQIQNDYITAAKEILGVLPNIMPKLGELDYCIPGPNPSYKTNSTDAQSAYQDWTGSLYVGPIDENRQAYKIDHPSQRTYDNLANIFSDNPNVWKPIKDSMNFLLDNFDSYKYISGNWFSGSASKQEEVDRKKVLMDINLNYANNSLFQNFYEVFDKMMNKIYFNNMTSMYRTREDIAIVLPTNAVDGDKNLGYIPMAESGLDLTKNIMYYNDDTTKIIQDYKDAIATTKVNIAKLEPIKAEVSAIIKAAQDRRDANLLVILNGEIQKRKANCIDIYEKCSLNNPDTPKSCSDNENECLRTVIQITKDEYKKKYASCLTEEDMNFYDSDTIMNIGAVEERGVRCSDGIDNDLDGLIDAKDPDCNGAYAKSLTCTDGIDNDSDGLIDGDDPDCQQSGGGEEVNNNKPWNCKTDLTSATSYTGSIPGQNVKCEDRTYEINPASACSMEGDYYSQNQKYKCKWSQ